MNSKLLSRTLPAVVFAISATVMFSPLPAAYAATVPPPKPSKVTPAPALVREPVSVTVAQLNERVAQLPQLAGLQNGDKVIISDDGSVTGAEFQGTYIFRPAGSQVPLGPMYARWKDGLVAIHMSTDPANAANQFLANEMVPFATYMEQTMGTGKDYLGNSYPVAISQQEVTKPLIPEPTNSAILKLPDGTWLFRDAGNGNYTALTDVFVFQSGTTPMAWVQTSTSDHSTWVADGTQQPVGVMHQS